MTNYIDSIRLSSLFTNPTVKAAFERAERDNGCALVVPAPKAPVLIGGAARKLEDA
ncbi:hypothetical protein D3C72_2385020 [compost metagenome]